MEESHDLGQPWVRSLSVQLTISLTDGELTDLLKTNDATLWSWLCFKFKFITICDYSLLGLLTLRWEKIWNRHIWGNFCQSTRFFWVYSQCCGWLRPVHPGEHQNLWSRHISTLNLSSDSWSWNCWKKGSRCLCWAWLVVAGCARVWQDVKQTEALVQIVSSAVIERMVKE
jgi:hypothetical protein